MSLLRKRNVSLVKCSLGVATSVSSQVLVDWAELVTLDLSLYEQPGGKEQLVKQLEHAVQHVG